MLSSSNDITRPKPGTKSLPLGTSIFCGVSLVSVELEAVGDDDVLSLPDDFCVSTFGVSTVICISTGATGGTSIGVDTGASI